MEYILSRTLCLCVGEKKDNMSYYEFMDIRTHAEIVDLWPSPAALAGDINRYAKSGRRVSPGLVRKWRERNSIPSNYWRVLVHCASLRGIELTAEMLVEISDDCAA